MPLVGIFGNVVRRADVGRVVPTRRGDRHRNTIESPAGFFQLVAGNDDLVHRRRLGRNLHRRDRIRFRLRPELIDFGRIGAETDAVDTPVRRQNTDGDRNIVALALGVHRLFEQKCLAVFLFDAAAKLPAHQRMHLLVFVHRLFDPDQQALSFELLQVIVQIGITARRNGRYLLRDC